MKNILAGFSIILMLSGFNTLAFADEEDRQSGPEVSGEHKSDQGAEHGKAYAGSKEKQEKENKNTEDEDNDDQDENGKKDKKDKKGK